MSRYDAMLREMKHWDRVLDADVHRVVFQRCPHPEADRLRFSKAKVMPKGAVMCSHCGRDPHAEGEHLPCYSSTHLAMELVTVQMENVGAELHLSGMRESWTARFSRYPEATGPTAGIAICRAAIAASNAVQG